MKYVDAFAIADEAVSNLETFGFGFRPDTARQVALAAVPFDTADEIKSAMETALKAAMINQRWDGSIA